MTTVNACSNRSRVDGDKRTEDIEPRSDFSDALVDHTDARYRTTELTGAGRAE
jgi:hypothetical protein